MSEKVCPYCGESVKEIAKKCKHCHEWLKKGFFNIRSPFFKIVFPFIVFVVIFSGISTLASFKLMPKFTKSFMPKGFNENTKITILSHKEVRKENTIEIIGKIRNEEQEKWQNISIKAEYFDSDGEFIDNAKAYISEKLKPNEEGHFKIRFYCGKNINKYVKYKIKVVGGMVDMFK